MDQQHKKQAQFSVAYLLIALVALLVVQSVIARRREPRPVPMSELLEVETLDRTDIETLVSGPAIAAAKA